MDVSPWIAISTPQNNTRDKVVHFEKYMRRSMYDLALSTVDNSSPKTRFKMRVVNITGFGSLYEMAQCVPEITTKDCHLCLTIAIGRLANISTSARVLLPSCIVCYTGRKKRSSHIVEAICVPIVVAILLFSGAWFCIYRRKHSKPSSDMEDIAGLESLQFEFKVIKAATNNFSPSNKLGQGGFGVVYKGKLQDEQEIAVKRLSIYSGQGISEFKTEILVAAKLQHNNLAKLLGFSLHGEEKLLIYELLPNASLDKVLSGQNSVSLDWETRYKILLGTARGLLYLHEDSRLKIIHRDLKSSNILLDETMNPKITDFGLARLVGRDQIHADTSKIAGTYGYMAPEYALTGRFSVMSDAYSFGIIALEIISGHMCSSVAFPYHEESLPLRAWNLWKSNSTMDLVDPRLQGKFPGHEMERCIHISLLCIQEDSNKRLTMATIVSALNGHQVALSEPEPPLIGPSTNITFGLHQNMGVSSSGEFLSNSDNITEVYPR
ncbi:putative receptor-like protein kinase At4g00960 [Chenopodium quinoa]|uniref:putative receptor-like protein kinase At4g00960 n=1 Tax=Chenopodium quinoa TaxID=63459 RepID=UPI000B794F82|nr:putative receptor-like protein kinase At4g00960 [Chenopodium quinoa]